MKIADGTAHPLNTSEPQLEGLRWRTERGKEGGGKLPPSPPSGATPSAERGGNMAYAPHSGAPPSAERGGNGDQEAVARPFHSPGRPRARKEGVTFPPPLSPQSIRRRRPTPV